MLRALLFIAFCVTASSFMSAVNADPDPLLDFCMADVSANAPSVNGYPCKSRNTVTGKDFTYTGLRQAS
ncbi:hypothetical protein M758_6G153400 [Ceratodon purpureus]|nr:hypothetical protein M758_6G153400 [Ceratodon purpureus]